MAVGIIYIVHRGDFFRHGEDIYKIGHTLQTMDERMRGYIKGSVAMCTFAVPAKKAKAIETMMISAARVYLKPRPDHGSEYFEAPYKEVYALVSRMALDFATAITDVESEIESMNSGESHPFLFPSLFFFFVSPSVLKVLKVLSL